MAPMISPDFSESAEFTPIPAGTYKVRIIGCESKTSTTGNQRLMWKLQTFGAEKPVYNNRIIFHGTPISGKGAGFLKAFYKAATGEDVTSAFDTETLLGKELQVTIVDGKNFQTGEPTDWPEVKAVARLSA